MELEKELQESIKKNLPQQVGEVLKQRLEQADKDAAEVKIFKAENERLEKSIKEFREELKTYIQFDTRNGLLESREKEIEKKERDLEIETLKYQISAEKDKTEFSKNIALGLVRNTEYRKTIFDTEDKGGQGVIDGQGNYHYPMPTSKHYDEKQITE